MDVNALQLKPWFFLVAALFTASSAFTSASWAQSSSSEIRYLDPDVWNIVTTEDHCFNAAPKSLLEVEPVLDNNGHRVYKVSQYFDSSVEKNLYAKPLESQIKDRKIVGQKFCNGIVSISDMKLPFPKDIQIVDANDGVLLTDAVRRNLGKIYKDLQAMKILALRASDGTNSQWDLEKLDQFFQTHKRHIESIGGSARFGDIFFLNGSQEKVDVPIDKGNSHFSVSLMNATIGYEGLNIANEKLYDGVDNYPADALSAVTSITTAEQSILGFLDKLKSEQHFLKTSARDNAIITFVDVRSDDFIVQRKRPSVDTVVSSTTIMDQERIPQVANMPDQTFGNNDCIKAAPGKLLLVTPVDDRNSRHYRISQTDGRYEYIYDLPLKDQINERKILGNELCKGVVSISNMSLPFAKARAKLSDANDGVLLIEAALTDSTRILKNLEGAYNLAQDAALNSHSDTELMNLNTEFQLLLSEISRIANSSAFNGFLLFNFDNTFYIPINPGHKFIAVPTANLTTSGLSIADAQLFPLEKAQTAFNAISQAIPTVKQCIHSLKTKKPALEAAAKREAVITSLDLTGDEFIVRRTEPQP